MKLNTKKIFAVCLILLLVLTVGCDTGGEGGKDEQEYPTEAIDMTILFGAGGGADVVGRKLADIASDELGQPIVANNRTGAGGAVGYQYVLSQDPDGYNIVWNSTSINVTYHQGNMPEDQDYSAFRGVAKITEEASALAVRADDDRFNNIKEFIEYCKENPGEVSVANSGVGSFNHLVAAAIEQAAGIKFKHIPMDAKKSTTALIGGQVDAMVNMAFDVIQQVDAGTLKALGVVAEERLEQLPEIPTMVEEDVDVTLTMYRGIAVPQGTRDDIVETLEDAFLTAAATDEFKEFVKKYGVAVKTMGAGEFDAYMKEMDDTVAETMELIGMKKQ